MKKYCPWCGETLSTASRVLKIRMRNRVCPSCKKGYYVSFSKFTLVFTFLDIALCIVLGLLFSKCNNKETVFVVIFGILIFSILSLILYYIDVAKANLLRASSAFASKSRIVDFTYHFKAKLDFSSTNIKKPQKAISNLQICSAKFNTKSEKLKNLSHPIVLTNINFTDNHTAECVAGFILEEHTPYRELTAGTVFTLSTPDRYIAIGTVTEVYDFKEPTSAS